MFAFLNRSEKERIKTIHEVLLSYIHVALGQIGVL